MSNLFPGDPKAEEAHNLMKAAMSPEKAITDVAQLLKRDRSEPGGAGSDDDDLRIAKSALERLSRRVGDRMDNRGISIAFARGSLDALEKALRRGRLAK